MKIYAKLIVSNNSKYTDDLFTYGVPDYLQEFVKVGHRVLVPFGRGNKPLEGFIFEFTNDVEDNMENKIKFIIDILDEEPLLRDVDIDLIKWMRNRYICTYMDAINCIYPKGYKLENYKVAQVQTQDFSGLDDKELYIIHQLMNHKGKMKIQNIKDKKDVNINRVLSNLKNKGIISISWEYKSNKNEKKMYIVSLNIDNDETDDIINNLIRKRAHKQARIIQFLSNNEESEINDLIEILDTNKQSITALHKKNIINIEEKNYYRKPKSLYNLENKNIKLNDEQEDALKILQDNMFNIDKKPYLIHGVTGSGKTEVYLNIIQKALDEGLDSIVLVPEISLTPQTISRFKNRFGDIVGVFHSQLSNGERHDVYRLVKEGKVRIIVGARSALFIPCNNLGVIIIDEFHEGAYKSEKNPKYNTIEVAKYISKSQNPLLILGSATPPIEEYYKAKNNEYELLELTKRANNNEMPSIYISDMKEELSNGNKSIFSRRLQYEMENTLNKNNQIILFLNRRGYASFVSCRNCGFVFSCDNCDISLTYHKYKKSGRCHYCGYEAIIPKECPECSSPYIKEFGIGTERIEEEVKVMFPNAKIIRMDKDTTSKKGSIEEILNKFKNKEADILIGTQMISKGHDFPNVTLVGILSADMILKFPDFRSSENTFQLITQVAGRAGRADLDGKVILQTYDVDHYSIKHAVNYDYKGFYEDEIKIRNVFSYAPFNNMISVVISNNNEQKVIKNIKNLHESIVYLLSKRGYKNFDFMLGPNPCPIAKINQNHRWQILFKDVDIEINLLKSIIKYICITKRDAVFDEDVNISVDINPYSIL